jgi:hypothetical protein
MSYSAGRTRSAVLESVIEQEGRTAVMPLNDVHLELYRLERQRWSLPISDALVAVEGKRPAVGGLRYRLGQALISSGLALTGPAASGRRTSSATRPVSVHR